jgi:hypothetical protein
MFSQLEGESKSSIHFALCAKTSTLRSLQSWVHRSSQLQVLVASCHYWARLINREQSWHLYMNTWTRPIAMPPSMHAMLVTSQAHISETRSRGQQQKGNNDFTSHLTQQSRIHSQHRTTYIIPQFPSQSEQWGNTLAQVEIPENRTVIESCHFSDCNATKYWSDHS